MIFRLSWQNFKAHFYDYLIYFIVMIFTVAVYYSFNAMMYNEQLVDRAGQNVHITTALNSGSLITVAILLFFMLAANRFFLKRRKTEVGVYRLAGARKIQIFRLFFVETFIIGFIALFFGIILGIILSKLFAMILVKAMFLTFEVPMSISFYSMLRTSVMFLFILIIVSLQMLWMIYQYSLEHLLRLIDQKEQEAASRWRKQLIWGVFGFLCIILGDALALNIVYFSGVLNRSNIGLLTFFISPVVIFLLCVIGTLLFFRYTMYIFVYLFSKRKKSYFRDLRMVALGNVRGQIQKTGTALGTITVFIAFTLACIGGAALVYTLEINAINISAPVDFIIDKKEEPLLREEIEADKRTAVKAAVQLQYKLTGALVNYQVGSEALKTAAPINFLSFSSYQSYKKINPYLPEINQPKNNETILFDDTESILRGFVAYKSPVILENDLALNLLDVQTGFFGDASLLYDLPVLIVSDERFQQLKGYTYSLIALNLTTKDEEVLSSRVNKKLLHQTIDPVYSKFQYTENQLTGYISKAPNSKEQNIEATRFVRANYMERFSEFRDTRREMGLLLYVAMFLGVLAIVTTGSILMLRQLSELDQVQQNYELLWKIGVTRKELSKLVFFQQFAKEEVEVLFIIPPVNQHWTDYTGLSQEMLQDFTKKVSYQLESQGFHDILDLSKDGSVDYFMADTIHLGWRGWLYADQAIQQFLESDGNRRSSYHLNSYYYTKDWQEKNPKNI